MNKTLFALLTGIVFLFEVQGNPTGLDITGAWEFERAEYMERQSFSHPYQVKYVIEKEEELYALEAHFSNMIKTAIFGGEIAIVYDLFTKYCGRYSMFSTGNPEDNQGEIVIGGAEEMGLEMDDYPPFNAPGFRYLIDRKEDDRIGITLERTYMKDSVTVFGAVRCILKKVS